MFREFSEGWQEIDSKIESGIWQGGTYTATFTNDPTTIITYRLEIISFAFIKWTIYTPTSSWYPGTHSGTLQIPENFPFKPPRLFFKTPIFSPNVIADGGGLSIDMLFEEWEVTYRIKDIMDVVGFMLAIDPLCRSHFDDRVRGKPLGFHDVNRSVTDYRNHRDSDAFMRATNFFARAYAQSDVELITDPTVTEEELEISVKVIKELLEASKIVLNSPPEGSISTDPSVAFSGPHRISDWREKERRWAKEISVGFGILSSPSPA